MLSIHKIITEKVSLSSITNYTSDAEILREAILAEYDAANLYKQMAAKVKDPNIREVLNHVAEEELHHVGEFEALLKKVDPSHESAKEDGEDEVRDMGLEV